MQFGAVPVREAEGAVLAHSLMMGRKRLPKGCVLTATDVAAIAAAGHSSVTVARLEAGDIGEDAAAARLAAALVPDPKAAALRLTAPQKGRVNLLALGPGVVEIDRGAVLALNRVDPALTLAVLPPFARVAAGTMVGTVKIIAYAVAGAALEKAEALATGSVRVRPVQIRSAGLILTEAPGQARDLGGKAEEAVRARLRRLAIELCDVVTVPHEEAAIATALAGLKGGIALILTGAATSDSRDVAPEALRRAGGSVTRFGMPVDPGNLLFYGALGLRPVIGLPGCARSPALNGADWVLERIACGITPTDADIAAMAVGGLLKEIPIRPEPRERAPRAPG